MVREAVVVGNVLREFCYMSGQQVIFSKSYIVFGAEVHTRQRGCIKRELHMTESWCPIHYLGVAIGIK